MDFILILLLSENIFSMIQVMLNFMSLLSAWCLVHFDVFLCLHEDDNMCLLLWGRICKYQFGQISCQCFPVLFMLKAFYLYLYGWWREALTSLFVIVDFHFSVLLVLFCVYWHFFVECSNLGVYVTLRFEKQFLKLCVFIFTLFLKFFSP